MIPHSTKPGEAKEPVVKNFRDMRALSQNRHLKHTKMGILLPIDGKQRKRYDQPRSRWSSFRTPKRQRGPPRLHLQSIPIKQNKKEPENKTGPTPRYSYRKGEQPEKSLPGDGRITPKGKVYKQNGRRYRIKRPLGLVRSEFSMLLSIPRGGQARQIAAVGRRE